MPSPENGWTSEGRAWGLGLGLGYLGLEVFTCLSVFVSADSSLHIPQGKPRSFQDGHTSKSTPNRPGRKKQTVSGRLGSRVPTVRPSA